MTVRRSGLQSDVLNLFRLLLRTASKKDKSGIEKRFVRFVSLEFRAQAKLLEKKDFKGIEHALRHGHKQLKLMSLPGFDSASKM